MATGWTSGALSLALSLGRVRVADTGRNFVHVFEFFWGKAREQFIVSGQF
jgi:hypothetical protein